MLVDGSSYNRLQTYGGGVGGELDKEDEDDDAEEEGTEEVLENTFVVVLRSGIDNHNKKGAIYVIASYVDGVYVGVSAHQSWL